MRALDPEVVDAVREAVSALLPAPTDDHPLGCHRPRVPDRLCFEGILVRLATGCSWVDAETLTGGKVSDTTLRGRRDQWVAAGVFDRLVEEALAAWDRIVGLDVADLAVDGSRHKAPAGGPGTGPNCADRAKRGWKWSIATEASGIPVGWVADAANRHDSKLLEPTLDAVAARGLLVEVERVHLDRGYSYRWVRESYRWVREAVRGRGVEVVVPPIRPKGRGRYKKPLPFGVRWSVERTNSWLTNFGRLRRNTDRHVAHRLAQLALAIVLLVTAKLIDWRNRWSP